MRRRLARLPATVVVGIGIALGSVAPSTSEVRLDISGLPSRTDQIAVGHWLDLWMPRIEALRRPWIRLDAIANFSRRPRAITICREPAATFLALRDEPLPRPRSAALLIRVDRLERHLVRAAVTCFEGRYFEMRHEMERAAEALAALKRDLSPYRAPASTPERPRESPDRE